jgi:hypothetical protein
VIVRFIGDPAENDQAHLSARVIVRPTLPFPALRELLGEFRGAGRDAGAVVGPDRPPGAR